MALTGINNDEQKLAQMILYISQKCATCPTFGATLLNKILYFSDFLAFGNLGKSITGVEYQNLRNGPAPRRLLPVRNALVENDYLVVQELHLQSGRAQHRTVNLVEADLSIFDGNEIAQVDRVIQSLWNKDAEGVSLLTHRMVGWQMTMEGETIPYESIFLSSSPLTEAEVKRGHELAKELAVAH